MTRSKLLRLLEANPDLADFEDEADAQEAAPTDLEDDDEVLIGDEDELDLDDLDEEEDE